MKIFYKIFNAGRLIKSGYTLAYDRTNMARAARAIDEALQRGLRVHVMDEHGTPVDLTPGDGGG